MRDGELHYPRRGDLRRRDRRGGELTRVVLTPALEHSLSPSPPPLTFPCAVLFLQPPYDAPQELLEAFHQLAAGPPPAGASLSFSCCTFPSIYSLRVSYPGCVAGVSLDVLVSWGPLQEAVSEGLLTTSEMQEAFGLVQRRDEGEDTRADTDKNLARGSDAAVEKDNGANEEVARLGLAAFVELALLLQQAIDRAIAAQTGETSYR